VEKNAGRKKVIRALIAALIAVAIVIAAMMLLRQHQNRFAGYLDKIEVVYQESNGIRTTNYVALLSEGVVWNESVDREGIADYVIKAALEEVESVEANHYNIIGHTAENRVIFMYSEKDGIVILYDEEGKPAEEVKYK
jgi:hypothetical protein